MKIVFFSLMPVLLSTEVFAAGAAPHTATITRKIGKAALFINPQKVANKKEKQVLIDGKYFTEVSADPGKELKPGDILQTGNTARVRLIYDNGDQVTVSPKSIYTVTLDEKKRQPEASVLMGKIRAVVDSEGPRNGMEVRTRSAVMGIRGTDFFINANGQAGKTELTVIRGKVAVKPVGVKEDKPVEVPAGFSANIGEAKPTSGASSGNEKKEEGAQGQLIAVNLEPVNTKQLAQIQNASAFKPHEVQPLMIAQDMSAEEKIKIEQLNAKLSNLESKAVETTLGDIKRHDPALYEEIARGDVKISDTDLINKKSVKGLEEKLPEIKKKAKPKLQGSEEDPYDRYYRVE